MPLLELRILEIHSFPLFFSYMLWHIELKLYIWLCFTVLQIKFECYQFVSIFVGVMPPLELRILEIQFSALFSYMLRYIELTFCIWLCLMYYRSSLSPSILSEIWNLTLVSFMHFFFFRKVSNRNSLLKCSWRAYYAPFAQNFTMWQVYFLHKNEFSNFLLVLKNL